MKASLYGTGWNDKSLIATCKVDYWAFIFYKIEMTTKQILYENNKYSKWVAYLCRLFGVHYIYLGKRWMFFLYFFTMGGLWVRMIIDIFRIPWMVDNENLKMKVMYGLDD